MQVLSQSPEGEQSDRKWSCVPGPSGRHTDGCGETSEGRGQMERTLENDAENSSL